MRAVNALRGAWGTLRWISTHPIAARDRRGAFARWARWQIGSRILPGATVIPFVEGTALLVEPGMTGATGNIYVGLHEFADMAFVVHYLREGDVFIDVGANVGTYTILAAGVRRAETLAVEPLPAAFARLRMNVRLNDLDDRVTTFNVGLASTPGVLRFTRSLDTVNHVVANGESAGGDTTEVPVTTLDALTAERPPSVVKVDVEGFETEVFGGAGATLARPELRAIIVELNGSGTRYGFDERALERRIESFGFRPYEYDPFTRSLRTIERKSTEGNSLYLRDLEQVETRVREAPAFRVFGVAL
jgi:FkbM family methyltransferase